MPPEFRQTIMWTALPNGVSRGVRGGKAVTLLRLSAFVSPRLGARGLGAQPAGRDGTGSLDMFPDFADWGAHHVSFSVRFANGATVEAEPDGQPPDPSLWRAVFGPRTRVDPFRFARLDTSFLFSYPAARVHNAVKKIYRRLAADSTQQLPNVGGLLGRDSFGDLVLHVQRGGVLFPHTGLEEWPPLDEVLENYERYLKTKADGNSIGGDFSLQPEQVHDFLKLLLFLRPRTRKRVEDAPPPVAPPDPDFHAMLSLLNEYPFVLRRLGIVRDLVVPAPPAAALGNPPTVTLVPHHAPANHNGLGPVRTFDITPRTAYTTNSFRAADSPDPDSDLRDGFLRLDDAGRFETVQVDLDGAALKAFSFANTLFQSNLPENKSSDTPAHTGAPSLRSGGVSVVRKERGARFTARAARAKQMDDALAAATGGAEPPKDPTLKLTLFADDLTRGYRVDVLEGAAADWRTLCARRGEYAFRNQRGQPTRLAHVDEGTVTTGLTSTANAPAGGRPPDVYLQESLFMWPGWSLCVRRPGIPVASGGEQPKVPRGGASLPPAAPSGALAKSYGLDVKFTPVGGTLPRLRFGQTYRVRARAVDLAGNSRPLNDPSQERATPPFTYTRFEPVGAPHLVLANPKTDGESMERPVVRTFSDTSQRHSGATARHVAPPKTAQLTAETHGAFDKMTAEASFKLITEHERDIVNPVPPSQIDKPEKEHERPVPFFTVEGYLPEVLATGVRAEMPAHGLVKLCPFYPGAAAWPDAQVFQLSVVRGDKLTMEFVAPPSVARPPAVPVLKVTLPPAEEVKLLLSSTVADNASNALGICRWLGEVDAGGLKKLSAQVAGQGSWLVNPARELTLVHAVQQPLQPPAFRKGWAAARTKLAQTTAPLTGEITVHGKSTVKLDLLAEWDEYTDAGDPVETLTPIPAGPFRPDPAGTHRPVFTGGRRAAAGFQKGKGSAHVCELPVARTDASLNLVAAGAGTKSPAHEFGDTKHRFVRYKAVATTRFREYFTSAIERAKGHGWEFKLTRDSGEASAAPPAPAPSTVHVYSTARPAAPRVQYVVPFFNWKEKSAGGVSMSVRRAGLRVYLDPPWFSSGEGELLGVVYLDKGAQPSDEKLGRLVTRWGRDPIYETAKPLPALSDQNFTLNLNVLERFPDLAGKLPDTLSLAEYDEGAGATVTNAGPQVRVAGYEVKYENGRRFCDVALEQPGGKELGAYFPFVRLALARFQPHSLKGAHLSPVVLTDFIQIPPDRMVSVAKAKPDEKSPPTLLIKVWGRTSVRALPKISKETLYGPGSVMFAALQQRVSERATELDWVPGPGGVVTLQHDGTDAQGVSTWSGVLTLPAAKPAAVKAYRLLVTESEILLGDIPDAIGRLQRDPMPGPWRVVYADTLKVDF